MICPMCATKFDEAFGVCPRCGCIVGENKPNNNRTPQPQNKPNNYQPSPVRNNPPAPQPAPVRNTPSVPQTPPGVASATANNSPADVAKTVVPIVAAVLIIIAFVIGIVFGGEKDTKEVIISKIIKKEYTAEELASKSINQIISIMDDEFEVEADEYAVFLYEQHVYIYNDDVLPGFKFYVEDATEDWDYDDDNLEDVKENLLDGYYEDLSFILVEDESWVDDDIQIGMYYDELTRPLGEFTCDVGDDVFYMPNDECMLIFEHDGNTSDYMTTGFTPDDMRELNFELVEAFVYPDYEADYEKVEESTTTEPTTLTTTTTVPTTLPITTTTTTRKETTTKKPETTRAETTTKKEPTTKKPQKSLFQSMKKEYLFTSGAGAWSTSFTLEDDGSFYGEYHDSDYDCAYGSVFEGKFTEPVKIDEYTYVMQLEYLTTEREDGEVYYENGVKHIAVAPPYGFEDAEDFYIYLPGKPLSEIPEGYLSWVYLDEDGYDEIPEDFNGIYNENAEDGFQSTD